MKITASRLVATRDDTLNIRNAKNSCACVIQDVVHLSVCMLRFLGVMKVFWDS